MKKLFVLGLSLTALMAFEPKASYAMSQFDAALQVSGYADSIPMMAMHCDKKFNLPETKSAGIQWTERHQPLLDKADSVIAQSGGIPGFQKDMLDGIMKEQITSTVNNSENPKQFCTDLGEKLNSGSLDLDRSPDFRQAILALTQ
ncbi:MAG: hypothetical protein CMP22_05915 [Rickettsiales bacterium]|nr:hypothetical protein [Rickettsiales bacterium]